MTDADDSAPQIYTELRKLAAAKLAHEKPGQTLDATALVHDAYRLLVRAGSVSDGATDSVAHASGSVKLIELRYFDGLTCDDAAEVMGISQASRLSFWHPVCTSPVARNETLDQESAMIAAPRETKPAKSADADGSEKTEVTRAQLIELLNEDLAREYQAIIAYVVYSQVIKGAEYMTIAKELEVHAKEELEHAIEIAKQIDYLGGTPVVTPKPVNMSKDPKQLLVFDLENENETVAHYRDRIRQCEALGEYAIAESLREIIVQEQEHQIDLATALGQDVK